MYDFYRAPEEEKPYGNRSGGVCKRALSELYDVHYEFKTSHESFKEICEELAKQHPELIFEIDFNEECGDFHGSVRIGEGTSTLNVQKGFRSESAYLS